MLKLIKYEFRKNMTAIFVLLGLTVALEGYFLYAMHAMDEVHLVLSIFGLMMCAYAAVIYVLVTGVTTYSRELKDRSAYLIFMTPNSALKIMGSKFLYAFVNALLFAVLYAGLAATDILMLTEKAGELDDMISSINELMLEYGIHLDQIAFAVLVMAAYMMLSILSFMALTYLAVTLSHTLFRDKKWRGFASLVIFFGLNWLVGQLNGLLPSAMDVLVYTEAPGVAAITAQYGIQTTATIEDVLLAMLPQAGVSLGVILVSLFGCAWMLEKKVNL